MYECTCIRVSVSMPEDLVRTVRDHAGPAMFDKYIAAAVEQRLRTDQLNELPAELETEFGPIPLEMRKQTADSWPA